MAFARLPPSTSLSLLLPLSSLLLPSHFYTVLYHQCNQFSLSFSLMTNGQSFHSFSRLNLFWLKKSNVYPKHCINSQFYSQVGSKTFSLHSTFSVDWKFSLCSIAGVQLNLSSSEHCSYMYCLRLTVSLVLKTLCLLHVRVYVSINDYTLPVYEIILTFSDKLLSSKSVTIFENMFLPVLNPG